MVKLVHWIRIEAHDSSRYDKNNSLDQFLTQMDIAWMFWIMHSEALPQDCGSYINMAYQIGTPLR